MLCIYAHIWNSLKSTSKEIKQILMNENLIVLLNLSQQSFEKFSSWMSPETKVQTFKEKYRKKCLHNLKQVKVDVLCGKTCDCECLCTTQVWTWDVLYTLRQDWSERMLSVAYIKTHLEALLAQFFHITLIGGQK